MQFAYKCLSTILHAPDTHSHSYPLPLQHTPHPPTHLYMYVWHGITHFRGSVVEIMVNIDQEISINYLPQHHPLVVVPDIHWSSAAGFCTVTNYICHPRQPLHPSREQLSMPPVPRPKFARTRTTDVIHSTSATAN